MSTCVNMDVRSKIFIWANSNIDGATSVITLGHIFPEFEYQSAFFGKFPEQYLKWVEHNINNYDKIFIVGMVIDQQLMTKIDDSRVVIISDKGDKLKYYESTVINEKSTSCSKLIFKKFKDIKEIPLNTKKLIAYVDDYTKYELKHEESKYLNALYRRLGYRNFYKFVERFSDGYDGFTFNEIEIIESYFKEIKSEISKIDIFKGFYKDWSIISTFTKLPVNEIAKELMEKYDNDMFIIINPDTKFVSFRKPLNSPADIVYLAEKLCDGGGSEYASGGSLTQKFLDFTTKLEQI
jgi:hypothetical protein